jgi:23S rRNA (cytidine2498-2'-O)-methyltransferase
MTTLPKVPPQALLLLTRAGFEPDLCLELSAWVEANITTSITPSAPPKLRLEQAPGVVLAFAAAADLRLIWQRLRDWRVDLVFARELLLVFADLPALPAGSRTQPILQAIEPLLAVEQIAINDCHCYAPDADATRTLLPMTSALDKALRTSLQSHCSERAKVALQVVFLSSERALICLSDARKSAPVPGGIPRLKFPPAAPSRSTLKLDEAILLLLSEHERAQYLQRGMHAVDLGACPGGWTYQLVRRGLRVIAIDNGAISETLMRTGLVEHVRADGFRWLPKKPVDWMVCDMVEAPLKVAQLAVTWISRKHCRYAIVNFKMPMKKRLAELDKCRAAILAVGAIFRCKQLYHDREEVTAFITLAKDQPK